MHKRSESMEKHQSSDSWQIYYFVDSEGYCPFQHWFLRKLTRTQQFVTRHAIAETLVELVSDGRRNSAIRSLGSGLFEFRLAISQRELLNLTRNFQNIPRVDISKVLLRIFYTLGPDKTIVILSGYDKLGNSHKRNQQKEIEQARKYRKQWLKVEM